MSRVLVVDDELGIRDLFCEILVEEGHEALGEQRGRRALPVAIAFRPDLVILDLWLRDTDGFAVLEELRQHYGDEVPPVLMLSGRLSSEDERRVRDLGAYDVLEKPVALARLLTAVYEGLSRGHSSTSAVRREPRETAAAEATLLDELCRLPLREARDAFERHYFSHLLQQCDRSVSKVARLSGVERTNLYRKLKQLGL